MVSKPEFYFFDFWVKIGVFINLNSYFCNLADKVLKYRVKNYYLTCFKVDAELFNLHISLSCILKNPTKIFSFLPQIRHFDIQVYFVKCTYCYYLYIWTLA